MFRIGILTYYPPYSVQLASVFCPIIRRIMSKNSTFSVHYPMFSVHYPMFSVHYPMFSVHYPMFSVQLSPPVFSLITNPIFSPIIPVFSPIIPPNSEVPRQFPQKRRRDQMLPLLHRNSHGHHQCCSRVSLLTS